MSSHRFVVGLAGQSYCAVLINKADLDLWKKKVQNKYLLEAVSLVSPDGVWITHLFLKSFHMVCQRITYLQRKKRPDVEHKYLEKSQVDGGPINPGDRNSVSVWNKN